MSSGEGLFPPTEAFCQALAEQRADLFHQVCWESRLSSYFLWSSLNADTRTRRRSGSSLSQLATGTFTHTSSILNCSICSSLPSSPSTRCVTCDGPPRVPAVASVWCAADKLESVCSCSETWRLSFWFKTPTRIPGRSLIHGCQRFGGCVGGCHGGSSVTKTTWHDTQRPRGLLCSIQMTPQ